MDSQLPAADDQPAICRIRPRHLSSERNRPGHGARQLLRRFSYDGSKPGPERLRCQGLRGQGLWPDGAVPQKGARRYFGALYSVYHYSDLFFCVVRAVGLGSDCGRKS